MGETAQKSQMLNNSSKDSKTISRFFQKNLYLHQGINQFAGAIDSYLSKRMEHLDWEKELKGRAN